MMLARVADSLYWAGRYVERAEHVSRLAQVMLNATLDPSEAAGQVLALTRAALGAPPGVQEPLELARALSLDRDNPGSVVVSLARARENARQVRDQITTESWERLNMLYLRAVGARAGASFNADPLAFLGEIVSDLHLFKGAADSTMSHGEGWRFMVTGVFLERAQLIGRLLKAAFTPIAVASEEPLALVTVLRMACALEPYLRTYTADLNSRFILEFLMFDEDFPRSIRHATDQIERHLSHLARGRELGRQDPQRLAGRLNARLAFADIGEVEGPGAGELLAAVEAETTAIHEAMYETFVAYPLELRLPAA
ncbi:MAG: alpha-E domain-containing protein [Alphaproteobacteria bacterium]|nr:alpha-E domain-containing protein [Alphaproteobacteria bacterium]